MINLIRVGDATDHGGKVETGSTKMRFDGRFVARKGDLVSSFALADVLRLMSGTVSARIVRWNSVCYWQRVQLLLQPVTLGSQIFVTISRQRESL
ncbi:PAAR domain-containing protein [Burkholderia metallica]|uniref:PAAR domain-containing protein n=1 Tax=Burkholderia metallica TaxID=488729 RepID=UPI001CF5AE6E|nr:PAAR domain-containing protein [Burkholderia metallica]MCA8002571.1 PAAR domain-containing protein [Burkholderia metallica]